ncbi:neuromusculin isoform X1 [Megalopta genalis]|uniref:neuromusculin isoform X1 n=1 Tax=Megalopta genalis TaxID=115081 RepID=UPI001443684F|nr:hemicentin-1 isoform X1 [Megalopta genalis]XP_033342890.1 hemicentin-1 isoform X1 [Megalopta genalis]
MADGLGHRRNRGTPANILLMVLAALHILHAVEGSNEPWLKSEKRAELGTEVELPCVLKSPQCNGLHSIKWYRDATRIIIFSEKGGTTRGNDDIAARSNIEYTKNMTTSYLKITDVKIEDEGLYKCEATYLTVNRKCNNVHHIMLNVTVHPKSVRVIDESTKSPLSTGTTLGPINEGSMISLYCESGEGKPVPSVEWYKDDQLLEATNSTTIGDNGIGTASSLLQMQITREELGATFTCKVNSTALVEPLTVDIKLDVHVRPLKMDLNGVVGHVVRGTNILLQCTVRAARPAANVTWQNGTEYLESNDRFEMFETKVQENNDSTSETISYLAFTATEYDNGRTFKCYAENSVTRYENLEPMKESTTIEVLYPPTVRMRPQNITVNETEDILIFCDYEANPATLTNVTWLRDDKKITLTEDHYEGGITEQTALTVKNATASDMGTYKCILDNKVGTSVSDDVVEVNVLYKPVVEVIMDPDTPVNEADRLNVSLTCEVVSGNPASLTAVRWYLNGDLLKELPDCTRNSTATTTSTEDLCDIDPSKLLLQAVDREFHGNCSCEGRNDAGWGPLSPSAPVIVYYKPGPASISYEPQRVIKKESLNITCSVQDPGLPKVVGFKWFRGLHRLPDANNATLTIGSVNLETEANFTCLAYNEAGDGDPATTFIDVSAAPAFINKLPSYRGFVYNASNVNITCWVECAPICNISWLKTNTRIDFTKTNRYYVLNVYYPPDPRKNDFESIQSTLVWNLTAWPGGQLDRAEDNVEFTCRSSDNGIGEAINSSTHVHVEFPPENVTISKKIVNVTVDTIPETVTCNANSHPKPAYRWLREGSNDTIMEGRFLDLKVPAPRRSNGTYYCEVRNRHGSRTIAVVLNVQFKPECHVEKEQIDGKDYVVCSAIANPRETDFVWSLKNDNDTLEQVAEIRNGKSYMRLDTSVTNFRTYICVVNNTIGYSNPCERDVPAHHGHRSHIPWWHQLEGNILLIIIVSAVVLILLIIIICVVIFIVCRRKRCQMKYPNQAANNNHVNSVSEGLPESGAKTFYENLPFHGIQAPPNKLVSPMFARVSALHGTLHHSIVAAACGGGGGSQPLSRTTSFCDASSGYESTRSHLGPHYSDYNMPRSNSPVPRYNSLKPRRRKHKRSQFYSLRLCRRHEAAQNRKYQLYAIPIYKCPHKNSSTSTLATIVTPDTPSSTNRRSPDSSSRSDLAVKETAAGPPVPAPRRSRKTDPSKHTYQNVPLPVFPPKNASLPKTKLDLATYVATVLVYVGRASSKFSLTQPPSDTQSRAYERARLRTDSLYNYKEHYQQQHRQEMQQYSYPLPSNSSSQLTLPLTRSLYHSSIVSPLQNSFVHANNRPSTLPHHETVNHLSAVHPDEDQQNYTNHDGARQPRRHASRGNERGQKYRKHKRADRKSKQRRGERACETSFHQVQELGIPETCKIAYPHYYEDNIAECPTEYHRLNPAARQQIWERRSNRSQGESTYYADPGGDTKTRNKSKNRLSSSSNLGDGRSPSAPTIMQYADLHFRDVGQEIDV